ncbi:hypothetical protein NEOLEDRAFT_1181657 [Neolentinus lepideus HHB14362 ss-1]|uniref:Uncharacterized protein n=1 Tax=Neolentinus lepideus HHB14362 ss-1 TaxID=1314782 RepID=A0A165PTI2_9AGAM|nr:hypothetical protein NEOLEDRAFT_1181657 [Neolentinus lepideus HHB14362 ss-1]
MPALINIDSLPPRLRRKEFIQRRIVEGIFVAYECADDNDVLGGSYEIHSTGTNTITNLVETISQASGASANGEGDSQGGAPAYEEALERLPTYEEVSERLPPYDA